MARGHRVSTWDTGQGRLRTHAERWRADVPGHDITLLASPRFRTLRRGPVRLVFAALPPAQARRILDLSHAALQELRARFGAPAIDAVQIVLSPRAGWGYSRPGLIVMSEKRLQGATEDVLREQVHQLTHELGALWWHTGSSPERAADPTTNDDWINEALAEYAALRATETLFGPRQAQAWRERYLEWPAYRRIAVGNTSLAPTASRLTLWVRRTPSFRLVVAGTIPAEHGGWSRDPPPC